MKTIINNKQQHIQDIKSIESAAREGLICSASGWRKVFSPKKKHYLQDHDTLFLFFAITAFLQNHEQSRAESRAKSRTETERTTKTEKDASKRLLVAIASDSRKTSPALVSLAEYAVQKRKQKPAFLGVVPIPVALAYTKEKADLLIYITASHNPKEYNGIKFCGGDGEILEASLSKKIFEQSIRMLRQTSCDPAALLADIRKKQSFRSLADLQNAVTVQRKKDLYQCYARTIEQGSLRGVPTIKKTFLQKISVFKNESGSTKDSGTKSNGTKDSSTKDSGKEDSGIVPFVLWDSNGGTRSGKMDAELLQHYGIGLKKIFTRLGVFVHEIVPEGSSMDMLTETLLVLNGADPKDKARTSKDKARTRPCFVFAILSDCDGDRGNSILYDFEKQSKIVLGSQEVFSLVVKIELAWQRFVQAGSGGANTGKLGIVINDASSYRVNQIAQDYSAQTFRSEVGEANVLALTKLLRKKHYHIPLSGEASNGGVILEPSSVRDPLSTAFSFLKGLLFYTELFPELTLPKRRENALVALLRSLPAASTTNTEDAHAKLSIPSLSTAQILLRICKNMTELFSQAQHTLQNQNVRIDSYRILNHFRHTSTEIQAKKYRGDQKNVGGISICLQRDDQTVAMLWLRKSKTEPVLRIIIDVLGKNKRTAEKKLLLLWRSFLLRLLKN